MIVADFFCGAGMATDGYTAAGLHVIGVDIAEQHLYPATFVQRDAFEALHDLRGAVVDVIHGSPPCQLHTRAKHLRAAQGGKCKFEVDLLEPWLHEMRTNWNHKPWVVENVPGAPMEPRDGEWLTVLCGSSFGLGVRRHRLFLTNFPVEQLACRHKEQGRPWGVYHIPNDDIPHGGRTARNVEHGREVMGVSRPIPWDSLKEGFPPAYTEHIGRMLLAHLEERAA